MVTEPITSQPWADTVAAQDLFSALNQVGNGFAIYDSNLELLFANKAVRKFLPLLYKSLDNGVSLKDSLMVQINEFYPDIDSNEVEQRAEIILNEIRNEGSLEVFAADGRRINSLYKKLDSGQFVLTCTDITERDRQQKALEKARQDADAANIAKSDFLANMSHEIRTPLAGVFMATQILQQRLQATNQTDLCDLADVLVGSTHHLKAIINDVLDLSKIEAGEIEIVIAGHSLLEMLLTLKASQDYVASDKGIELKLVIDPKLPDTLLYDCVHVRQCVTNLISNALKFTESGSVTIAVIYNPQSTTVTIHVADTGIGIALDKQAYVFDHFAQVKEDVPVSHMGTGLGLAISQKLAKLMGGDIKLTSELGRGSIFTLTFIAEPEIATQQYIISAA